VYWGWEDRASLAATYRVPIVQRIPHLETLSLEEVFEEVRAWEGKEGVVLRLNSGAICKIKSVWWLGATQYKHNRWHTPEHRELEREKAAERLNRMQTLQQRAIFTGRLGREPPSALLNRFPGADRVEVFFDRASGKRGAVVISFGDPELCKAAIEDSSKQLKRAYSVRSRGRGKTVRSWTRQDNVDTAPCNQRNRVPGGWPSDADHGMNGLSEADLMAGIEQRVLGQLMERVLGAVDIQGILDRAMG
jgi:hypothetical protein